MKVFTRATLSFYFQKKSYSSWTLRKLRHKLSFINTYVLVYCIAVNLSSTVLHRRYVFSTFRVEKLLSTEAVVTESTIQLNFKDILGARPTCAPWAARQACHVGEAKDGLENEL